jgi:L-seryl-tRNA(Ser) seleniumtransferase
MDRVLDAPALVGSTWRREVIRRVAEGMLATVREQLRAQPDGEIPDAERVAVQVAARLRALAQPHPRRVINATGVLLHTNLGRAPLSRAAIAAIGEAAGACDLELDLEDGRRGSRFAWLQPLLCAVIGAPDVHCLNNNAAGLLLACTVLGRPGGVALSHGQMVEIGDGFRVATMAAAGGCPVIGVGSTNRTHLADYEAALAPSGGVPCSAVLWVHLSNFEQHGFVAEVGLRELAALAHRHGVPLIADLGSGSVGGELPTREPTIAQYLAHGADLVLASGDKLLGGPQVGIVAGSRELVARVRTHPMARALRPDKTTIAALHATVVAHGQDEADLPLLRMVTVDRETLRARAQVLVDRLGLASSAIVEHDAALGGGSLPGDRIASIAVRLQAERIDAIARRLRTGESPVVGRIADGALLLDLRTVDPDDDEALALAVRRALAIEQL